MFPTRVRRTSTGRHEAALHNLRLRFVSPASGWNNRPDAGFSAGVVARTGDGSW